MDNVTVQVTVQDNGRLPKVIKTKKGKPTVIEWNNDRYVLDYGHVFKASSKRKGKKIEKFQPLPEN